MADKLALDINSNGHLVVSFQVDELSEEQLEFLRVTIPTLCEELWLLRRQVTDERNRRLQVPVREFKDYPPLE